MSPKLTPRHAGDWYEHYRVRWTDDHESIHYPSDGTRIRPQAPAAEK